MVTGRVTLLVMVQLLLVERAPLALEASGNPAERVGVGGNDVGKSLDVRHPCTNGEVDLSVASPVVVDIVGNAGISAPPDSLLGGLVSLGTSEDSSAGDTNVEEGSVV